MILNQKNGFLYFTFEKLAGFDKVRHAVFARANGFSRENFASLNLSYSVGDDESHVNENRKSIGRVLGGNGVVFAHQIHQADILIIDDNIRKKAAASNHEILTADGLVTQIPDTFIGVKLADCQSVMMYDPVKKIAANIHSGWRGSIQNIIGRCIESMRKHFDTNPTDIVAGISPSLGPCCAEFKNFEKEIPRQFWKYKDSRHHFDFWAVSRDQLVSSGVRPENIETADICTKCNSHLFFSYRKLKSSGRFAAVIGLK